MVDFTTTYTTTTTSIRFALDNDALRRVVAVAIRRGRCVRRGYKKEQRSCEKNLVLLFTTRSYRAAPYLNLLGFYHKNLENDRTHQRRHHQNPRRRHRQCRHLPKTTYCLASIAKCYLAFYKVIRRIYRLKSHLPNTIIYIRGYTQK
ncbi:hypothetical protein Halhy_2158 [Haliscomenobacter hydrossis DSM 1100]|uniref:Uncharacterized protein n=1 Tax=Haliscomenobacter hydrossis (strain ATCC 27775 / DSM 1100 / LMG 10767 / O) TaxID=760192 RepID=F4KRT8_HALH1|nr:hypothetical protein Halhy_2158 [Haliscomenobacter hydrossis DSM 1100]